MQSGASVLKESFIEGAVDGKRKSYHRRGKEWQARWTNDGSTRTHCTRRLHLHPHPAPYPGPWMRVLMALPINRDPNSILRYNVQCIRAKSRKTSNGGVAQDLAVKSVCI